MHRLKSLRPFLFAAGLAAALAVAWTGARTNGPGLTAVGGWTTDGTCSWPEPNPPIGGDYLIECDYVFPEGGGPFLLAGEDSAGLPLVASAYMTSTRPRRYLRSRLYGAAAETVATYEDEWFVCPTGARWPEPELLMWRLATWYEPASPLRHSDRTRLFRDNYARESKLLHTDHFMRSLRAAAHGESLAVESPLVALVPGEEERFRLDINPLYTADAGTVFESGDRRVAFIETDGGFHNVDRFYVLFDQPELVDGKAQQLLSTDDIEGGYRGLFAVDVTNGEELWVLRTGSGPVRTMASDLNGDGMDELLVQFYSAENGVNGNGMTDAGTSYVVCLDQAGHILWRKRFLGVHIGATAAIADMNGDGSEEVVVVCSSTRDMDMGHAAVISGTGETLAERSDLGGLYGIAVADFDGDGACDVVTGGPEGSVLMLNGELDLVASWSDTVDFMRVPNWQSRLGVIPNVREAELEQCFRRTVPLGSFDIDGDGDLEVVCLWTAWAHTTWRSHNRASYFVPRGDLVVFGSTLEEEARAIIRNGDLGAEHAPSDAPASLKTHVLRADMDGDGADEILLSNGSRGMFVFRAKRHE
jgi:hypothetical protein